MSHEPECPKSTQRLYGAQECPACPALRIAYKRGREDAVKAVEALAVEFGDSDWQLTVHASAVAYGIEMALTAARGGEQE